jgi:hypothetical protein
MWTPLEPPRRAKLSLTREILDTFLYRPNSKPETDQVETVGVVQDGWRVPKTDISIRPSE